MVDDLARQVNGTRDKLARPGARPTPPPAGSRAPGDRRHGPASL